MCTFGLGLLPAAAGAEVKPAIPLGTMKASGYFEDPQMGADQPYPRVPLNGTFANGHVNGSELDGELTVPEQQIESKLFGLLHVDFGLSFTPAPASLPSHMEEWYHLDEVSLPQVGLYIPTDCTTVRPIGFYMGDNVQEANRIVVNPGGTSHPPIPPFRCQGGFLNFAFGQIATRLLSYEGGYPGGPAWELVLES
jgi:hypothetical protein